MGLGKLQIGLELNHCLLEYVCLLFSLIALVLELFVIGIKEVLDLFVSMLEILFELPYVSVLGLQLSRRRQVKLLKLYALLSGESVLLL